MRSAKDEISELLDRIEDFKTEIEKRKKLGPEEKLAILKAYALGIFSETTGRNVQLQGFTGAGAPNQSVASKQEPKLKFETFAELVRITKFKQHPDLILLATYYLVMAKKVDSVTTIDIEQEYSSAMLKTSTNTNANINVNRAKGYMMEGEKRDGKKTFRITMSGVDYLESILAGIDK